MQCFECGLKASENHHVVPRSRGGTQTVPLCGRCHGLVHGLNGRADISTLTREGLARRKAAGLPIGRRRQLYVGSEVAQLRAQGLTQRQVAEKLGIAPSSVHRIEHRLKEG